MSWVMDDNFNVIVIEGAGFFLNDYFELDGIDGDKTIKTKYTIDKTNE